MKEDKIQEIYESMFSGDWKKWKNVHFYSEYIQKLRDDLDTYRIHPSSEKETQKQMKKASKLLDQLQVIYNKISGKG